MLEGTYKPATRFIRGGGEMSTSLALTTAVFLLLSYSMDARVLIVRNELGSGVPLYCQNAGFTSCCPGRDDSCLGSPPVCYCDEFCIFNNSRDCCQDLLMGLLTCTTSDPRCGTTLEARVRGLAGIQTVIAESFVGLPDHFPTTRLYLNEVRRQVRNVLFNPSDRNTNNLLDSDEFHLMFTAILQEESDLEICERDFLKFCDENKDGNITFSEIERCVGILPYCDTVDSTATLLAKELLAARLQPVFRTPLIRNRFSDSIFPFADRQEPEGILSMNEFTILYDKLVQQYNVLPSVCPGSVFELCNSNGDLFVSEDEIFTCGE